MFSHTCSNPIWQNLSPFLNPFGKNNWWHMLLFTQTYKWFACRFCCTFVQHISQRSIWVAGKNFVLRKKNDSNTRVNACLCELTRVYVCKRAKGWLRAGDAAYWYWKEAIGAEIGNPILNSLCFEMWFVLSFDEVSRS